MAPGHGLYLALYIVYGATQNIAVIYHSLVSLPLRREGKGSRALLARVTERLHETEGAKVVVEADASALVA